MRCSVGFAFAMILSTTAAHAQTSDEHEREIHRQSERNTQYHNNADDYNFKSGPATPPASTGNYHDYRKDTPAPSSGYEPPPPPMYKEFWFGKVITTSEKLSPPETFKRHLDLARQGVTAERMYVAQLSFQGVLDRSPSGETTFWASKNQPLAYFYYAASASDFPFAEYRMGYMQYYGLGANADCAVGLKHMQNSAARGVQNAVTTLTSLQLPLTGPLPASPKDCAKTLSIGPKKSLSEQLAGEFDDILGVTAASPAPPAKIWFSTSEIVFDAYGNYPSVETQPEVNRIADKIKATTGRYEIACFTEGDPMSLPISERRARWLRDAFIIRGIPADRLVAKGYGDTRQFPGRNDRVEIKPLD